MSSNELVSYQSEAVNLANLTESSKRQSVVLAAKTGQALIKVKELLGHGEYLPWIEGNMPVSNRQCAKYMKLATKNPSLLSNGNLSSHLDINSELKLLALDDNDQSEEIRDTANELELTQKQIADLTKQVKENEQTIEEWRQQFFDERKGKRELEEENRRIKESKKETIYIDDSEKALAQYKEETEGKLKTLLEESRIAKDELHRVETEKFNAINEGVNKKLENYDLQIENLQKQETALRNSIDILSDKEARLDDLVTAREKHSKAIKECKSALETVFIKAGVIFDGDIQTIHSDDAASWRKLKENIYAFGDEIEAKISALAVDD